MTFFHTRESTKARLLRMIQSGSSAEPVSATRIRRALNISAAEICGTVNELIEDGCMIGSSSRAPYGYYVIRSPEELENATAHLCSRSFKMLKRVARLKRLSIEQIFNQLSLTEDCPR